MPDRDDAIAEPLLSILSDPEESELLRATAATSLGPFLEEADLDGFAEDFDDPDLAALSEGMFGSILDAFQKLHFDERTSKEVRRRVLEASVRAPQDWHAGAIRTAWTSGDDDWVLTAAFCMRFAPGFEQEILEALGDQREDVRYEAVQAAGNWGIDEAWPTLRRLLEKRDSGKDLVLAAIESLVAIRPDEAATILRPLQDSEDEEIVTAVHEALLMAEPVADEEDGREDEVPF